MSPEVRAALDVYLIDAGEHPNWFEACAPMPTTPIADESEGAEMIYSSGTTGRPKGVRFPLSNAPLGTVSALFETPDQRMHRINAFVRYLSTAPLYHSAPLRYNLMVTRLGGRAVIMEKFDAEHALQLIERHRITHSQWVPTMFVRLLRLPRAVRERYDTSSLEFVIHAAAPCPVDIKRQMIDWLGPILFEYYSGTEANGSTAIDSAEWLAHPGSVGRAIHGELKILDEDDTALPPGETGTVYFANGSAFSYYKDPGKTRSGQGNRRLVDTGRHGLCRRRRLSVPQGPSSPS
ncbi:MAG: AMP-binding protein [Gammaproteobacteria bacterium]|nr:AMP-binding protein [Gammaproteobacteria bacterium]